MKLICNRVNLIACIIFMLFCDADDLFGQGLNQTFLLGYDIGLFDTNVTSTKARLIIDSNNIQVVPETRKMAFWTTQGNISDQKGNLIISTNGCWIANANGDTMLNGAGLNPGPIAQNWCGGNSGMPIPHGNLIIPFPGDTSKFILFHQTANQNLVSKELFYSVIDMSLDSGLGGVILKNQIVFQHDIGFGIAACKHANGRDWWIVALKNNSNKLYEVLVTPAGISSVFTKTLNVPFSYDNATQPTFSPDGTKFAYTYGYGGANAFHDVRLFHFDRCTGVFSDTTYIAFTDTTTGFGVAFSPNSKYLYHCSIPKIYQINTDTSDIIASLKTVATWDGFYSPYPPFGTYFWYMYLAANGKIYVTTGSTIDINFIDSPDSSGLACNVQQHALHLPCLTARASVNHPNYYLGPVIGSTCDSLVHVGINNINTHDFHFLISPNPSKGNIKIIYLMPQNKSGVFEIFDVIGNKIYSVALPPWSSLQYINLPRLSNGIYSAVITSGGFRESKKVVVINE